ncbi:hypothetical protein HYX00_04285 [Candidatus Woesearchaeota archaeon]|nr:hypothetical protein [Candidatus Woesearchaeota archaeon]
MGIVHILKEMFGGIFGIWGEKYERIFSFSPTILAFEEVREERRTFRYLGKEEEEIEQIQEDVKEHRVTAALRLFHTWINHMRKAFENAIRTGFSQIFQEFHILKITRHYGEAIQKIINHCKTNGPDFIRRVGVLLLKYLPKHIQDINESERLHGEDTRTLMAIMNKAKERGGKSAAKAIIALRRAFKGSISKLARIAMKREIKIELRNEKNLEHLAKRLEAVSNKLDSKQKGDHESALKELEQILAEGEHDMSEMFRDAHLIMKRDLLMIMVLLQDDDIIEQFGKENVQRQFLPESPISEGILSLNKLKEKLFEKAHTMANGLGVVVKNLEAIKRAFEVDLQEIRAAA